MGDKDRDEIDAILDSGLSSYSACKGSSGLEERVLNRVRYDSNNVRPRWPAASLAAVSIGCLAFALVFFVPARKPVVKTVQPLSVPQPIQKAQVALTLVKRAPILRQAQKLSQFPGPSPLSREEGALLVLAKLSPEQLTKLVSYNEEIRIEPLQVEPLDDEH